MGKDETKVAHLSFLRICSHAFDRIRTRVMRLKGVRAERERRTMTTGGKKRKTETKEERHSRKRERERESRLSGEESGAACEAKNTTATERPASRD